MGLAEPAPTASWQAVPGDLTTEWTAKVDPRHPLPEYPRPQMTRPQWVNLNGLWDYAITAKDAPAPAKFEGRILVPFGIESALSGVKKPLGPDQRLWYRRSFTTPDLTGGKRLLLHFGAVDWQATVFVNGKPLGQHQGGYDGFTLDVTEALKAPEKPAAKAPTCGAGVSPAHAAGTAAPHKPVADPQKPAGKVEPGKNASVKRSTGQPSPAQRERVARNEPGEGGQKREKAGTSPRSLTPSPSPDQPSFGARGRGELLLTKDKKKGKKSRQVKSDDDQQKGPQNELLVSVWNPCDSGSIACGRQSLHPHGDWHTATSGIWQTAWLEAVPAASIERLEITPDLDQGVLDLTVQGRGNLSGCTLEVSATGHNRVVGTLTGRGTMRSMVGEKLRLAIQEVHAWSPDDPFLYDLAVALKRGGEIVDVVHSYFAMRKIAVQRDAAGHDRIALNGKPLFNIGVADQGYWPDGLYTAPTDAALRFDVEAAKRMGFNTIRKRDKVEPERWYYHCDRLGVLVWQDVVRLATGPGSVPSAARRQYEAEMQAMVAGLSNHPSIVLWAMFHEDLSRFDQSGLAHWIKQNDTTRLLNGQERGDSDVVDVPSNLYGAMGRPVCGKVVVAGEMGRVAVPIAGHQWKPGGCWGGINFGLWETGMFYEDLMNRLKPMISVGLCGAIYAQSYDVESELSGLVTYDRKVFKVQPERLARVSHNLLQTASARVVHVTPSAQKWSYTTQKPPDNWSAAALDDSRWPSGEALFGNPFGNFFAVRTNWFTTDIWLRRAITLEKPPKMPALEILLLPSEIAEVYVDGRLAAAVVGSLSNYTVEAVYPQAAAALTPGKHILAVHCQQNSGVQAIDVGLVDLKPIGPGHAPQPRPIVAAAEDDIHMAPGGKWLEHDMNRPRPPVVDTSALSNLGQLGGAPSDAVVLFNGRDLAEWQAFDAGLAGPAKWKVAGGYMEVAPQGGNIYSKRKFADCQIHIEWASPAVVKGDGQGRGNSGVFPLGFGEIQVLDSFQNDTYPDGQAGGLYGHYPPLVNAARRPGQWQAYDFVIQMAKLDKKGRLVRPARLTLFHNGVVIHCALELPGRQREGTIGLQDHHNPTRFRNIWVRPLKDYDEAGTPPPAVKGAQ
jgi:hypothetical protein